MTDFVRYLGTRNLRWRLLHVVRAAFTVFGRSWNDFYAWMLNFQDRHLTLDQIIRRPRNNERMKGLWDWWRGEYYLDYMVRHGVSPDQTILDIGCGYGRLTIPCLKWQSGGRYIGTEISSRRLELAREWIEREHLGDKNFQLICEKDNSLSFLRDRSVDAAFVMSVFNHMPDRELDELLAGLGRVVRPGGKLFSYYLVPEETSTETIKTFYRTDDRMLELLRQHGFEPTIASDWDDDLEKRSTESRMAICLKT